MEPQPTTGEGFSCIAGQLPQDGRGEVGSRRARRSTRTDAGPSGGARRRRGPGGGIHRRRARDALRGSWPRPDKCPALTPRPRARTPMCPCAWAGRSCLSATPRSRSAACRSPSACRDDVAWVTGEEPFRARQSTSSRTRGWRSRPAAGSRTRVARARMLFAEILRPRDRANYPKDGCQPLDAGQCGRRGWFEPSEACRMRRNDTTSIVGSWPSGESRWNSPEVPRLMSK